MAPDVEIVSGSRAWEGIMSYTTSARSTATVSPPRHPAA
jgi:hypothetical protein